MLYLPAETVKHYRIGMGNFSDGEMNFSALDTKKVLARTPVGAVQQFMSWVRSVGRF
jgi:hypothetical protein